MTQARQLLLGWVVVLAIVGLACGLAYQLGRYDERSRAAEVAAAVESAGTTGADLDAACCPRFRPPQQADLDALTSAGGSLLVYVDAEGACCTLTHDGTILRAYAGHPLDAARGCLEEWIAEGGGR